jgi:hypothetical protein
MNFACGRIWKKNITFPSPIYRRSRSPSSFSKLSLLVSQWLHHATTQMNCGFRCLWRGVIDSRLFPSYPPYKLANAVQD